MSTATLLRICKNAYRISSKPIALQNSAIPSSIGRYISTSDKKKDVVSAPVENVINDEEEEFKKLVQHFGNADPNAEKNWISYGFDHTDRDFDTFSRHMTMFSMVSVGMVFTTFIVKYFPDQKAKMWARREARFQIERREALGLPVIDVNIVDPENVILPTEEELGEMYIRL